MALSVTSHSAVNADINVTPMADVMLVLLIIFMIVTPAITAGFQATIPRAVNPEAREEQDGEVRLGIDVEGKFYLDVAGPDGRYTGMRSIRDQDLQAQLTSLYAVRTVDKILYLKADGDLDFGRVQEAVEISRKAGVRVIAAIADQKRVQQEGGP